MALIEIRKAARPKAKLRVGMSGPSGSGKTYSALLLAKGITGDLSKVVIIDTENHSGELYSNMGPYNVVGIEAPYTPEKYIEAIDACGKAGMEVCIIDSVSHEWDGKGGLLESNELIAQTKFKGNTWAAWSVTTPRHQKFIEAILSSPMHIVTTARSKTDMIQTEDKKVKKVGMKDIQREGFEYELTLSFNLDREKHYAIASKDRTGLYSEQDPFIISEETGKQLKEWADAGTVDAPVIVNQGQIDADTTKKTQQVNAGHKGRIVSLVKSIMAVTGEKLETAEQYAGAVRGLTQLELKEDQYEEIIGRLKVRFDELVEAGTLDRQGKILKPVEAPKVDTTLNTKPEAEKAAGHI